MATVTLDRPEALNAISTELAADLADAVEPLATDPGVRAVVLTGAGERAFCVGADLKQRAGFDDHGWLVQREAFRRGFAAVRRCPLPTVAAVSGFALGGGTELALACDLVVAADDATFGLPEVRLGLVPAGGGTQLLVRQVGRVGGQGPGAHRPPGRGPRPAGSAWPTGSCPGGGPGRGHRPGGRDRRPTPRPPSAWPSGPWTWAPTCPGGGHGGRGPGLAAGRPLRRPPRGHRRLGREARPRPGLG